MGYPVQGYIDADSMETLLRVAKERQVRIYRLVSDAVTQYCKTCERSTVTVKVDDKTPDDILKEMLPRV